MKELLASVRFRTAASPEQAVIEVQASEIFQVRGDHRRESDFFLRSTRSKSASVPYAACVANSATIRNSACI